jgi:hypothetical protein
LNPEHGGKVSFQHVFALFNPLQRRQTDPSCVGEGAEIDAPFVTLARQGAGAFLLTSDALFVGRRAPKPMSEVVQERRFHSVRAMSASHPTATHLPFAHQPPYRSPELVRRPSGQLLGCGPDVAVLEIDFRRTRCGDDQGSHEHATPGIKAHLAEVILQAAAQGMTSYDGLVAAAPDQIQTIISISPDWKK